MTGTAIVTRNLVKRRGRHRALDGFTLTVSRGSIMGLVGANGAGKTTWMMTVAGFLRPDAGEIDVLGGGPFDATVHAGRFAILPQDSALPLEVSPQAALYRFGCLQGLASAAALRSATAALAAVNLGGRGASPVRTLSLDPIESDRLLRFILAPRGRRTVVVSSHNLKDIERLCTHVAFVEQGRVVRVDTLTSIMHGTDRIAYTLAAEPTDQAALAAAAPDVAFDWRERERTLVCTFDASAAGGIAAVNRRLLPALLAQTDVIAVSPGLSLEEAFLAHASL